MACSEVISWYLYKVQLPLYGPTKHKHIRGFHACPMFTLISISLFATDTAKLTGPQTLADKRWVEPAKLLCIIMLDISKIRPKSVHGQVKAKKFSQCLLPVVLCSWFVFCCIKVGMKWTAVINSMRLSDAIWRHRSGSTLAQVMACCQTAPSHYLSQCILIIAKV